MTKDIMRAAIANDIKKTKEDNIKFVNKMDQVIDVLQDIKYEVLCSQAQMDALIKNIDDMDSLQLASALTNTLCGTLNVQDKVIQSKELFSKILED